MHDHTAKGEVGQHVPAALDDHTAKSKVGQRVPLAMDNHADKNNVGQRVPRQSHSRQREGNATASARINAYEYYAVADQQHWGVYKSLCDILIWKPDLYKGFHDLHNAREWLDGLDGHSVGSATTDDDITVAQRMEAKASDTHTSPSGKAPAMSKAKETEAATESTTCSETRFERKIGSAQPDTPQAGQPMGAPERG